VVIWYIFPVLVFCTKKILATLVVKLRVSAAPISSHSSAFIVLEYRVTGDEQGCQIFSVAPYQNGKNIPNDHKMYQMTVK
jgi:hypothetical protein